MTTGYQALRKTLGDYAHAHATAEYERTRMNEHLFVHDSLCVPGLLRKRISLRRHGDTASLARNTLLRQDLDPYLSTLVMVLQTRSEPDFPLDPADPGSSRQPDLASVEQHDLYEIKPDTPPQLAAGAKQLEQFLILLQQGDAEWSSYAKRDARFASSLGSKCAEKAWHYGTQFVPAPGAISISQLGRVGIHYRPAQPGLLAWRTDADEERVRDTARELMRQVQPLLAPLPSSEEAAGQRGREILDRSTVLRDRTAVFVRQVGIAVAALAMAAAIVFLVASAPMAIAFALAVAISLESARPGVPSSPRLP